MSKNRETSEREAIKAISSRAEPNERDLPLVVLGEMVPKNHALDVPDSAALALAPPLAGIVRILHPFIALLNWIANRVLRAAGVTPKDEVASTFTRDEVAGLVEESRREGLLDRDEERLLVGALTFEERDASAVMIPRAELVSVPPSVTPAQVEAITARTGYSRLPIEEDGRLVGYLHLKDALEIEDVHRNRPIARGWIRPLGTVRASDPLRSVLATMQGTSSHLARVVDASGETLGATALEDVLEELVGEGRDETQRRGA